MSELDIQLAAGRVLRYHTAPIIGQQTVGEHTYNVLQILRFLTNDQVSSQLMRAALDHDVAEAETGDVPFPTKRKYLMVRTAIKSAEDHIMERDGLTCTKTREDANLLKFADMLEAGLFGSHQARMGNRMGRVIMKNILDAIDTDIKHPDIVPHKMSALTKILRSCYDGSE